MAELVTCSLERHVAAITLNRPEAGNALDAAMIDQFAAAIERLIAADGVRASLIAANGRHFCVGGDILAFASDPAPSSFVGRLAGRLHDGMAMLADHPAPVVLAAQGASAGAGLGLVASADIVLAAEDATFSMAYSGIGLTADGGATWSLPRLIGLRLTQEMAYLNRRLTAREAERAGLASRLAPADRLVEEATAVARTIADGPTAAFGGIKRLLSESARATFREQLDREAASISAAMATADARDAITAFVEKRRPSFQGR